MLVSVTLTLPVAPLSHVTEHLNVAPASDFTSVGHFASVSFTSAVESCCLMPLSTAAVSTIRTCGVGLDFAVLDELELPQPVTATAPATTQATIATRPPRRARFGTRRRVQKHSLIGKRSSAIPFAASSRSGDLRPGHGNSA